MTHGSMLSLLGVVAFGSSYLGTLLVRNYATRAGVFDEPNLRSSHSIPTPRGGGLAVLGAATLAVALGGAMQAIEWRDAVTLGVGAWVLGLLGWADDHKSLAVVPRLAGQLLVGVWTVVRFGGLPAVHVGALTVPLGWAGYVLGVVGVVWSTNLFNFMDGIDALAGSQAALIFSSVGLLLLRLGDGSLGLIACALGAASLGFLPWNWPRARIFLGDVGSAPLGYLVAALALASENRNEVPLVLVAMISGVFVVDATTTLVRRLLRGKRMSEAHRSHAYQRLARVFDSHGVVSLGAALETALFAGLATAAILVPNFLPIALFLTASLLAASLIYAERRAPMT